MDTPVITTHRKKYRRHKDVVDGRGLEAVAGDGRPGTKNVHARADPLAQHQEDACKEKASAERRVLFIVDARVSKGQGISSTYACARSSKLLWMKHVLKSRTATA